MKKDSKHPVVSLIAIGAICLIAASSYAAEVRYSNADLAVGRYRVMQNVDTHVCMLTGVKLQPGRADEEQIKRVGNDWVLYGGTDVEATCYAHADFYARTGGVGQKSFWNDTSWARATASPTNGCSSFVTQDTGDARGILYMRGFNGTFNDPNLNPASWNSYLAITQATELYQQGNPLLPRAKSRMSVRVDACTTEFYLFTGIFPGPFPFYDFTQRARLSVGWYKNGGSQQLPKFMTSDRRRVFPAESASEFRVSANAFTTREVGMALAFEAACYLTYVGGQDVSYDGGGESGSVRIENRSGRWTLIAKQTGDGHPIQGRARCYAYNQGELFMGPSPS